VLFAAREAGIKIVYLKMGFRLTCRILERPAPLTAYVISTAAPASRASLLMVGGDDS
jgi:hypothetical protein